MKKVKITEAQFIKLVLENDSKIEEDINTSETGIDTSQGDYSGDNVVEEITDVITEKIMDSDECVGDDLFESVEQTKGGLSVRNLVLENESIKGEYKSTYGQWYKIEWNKEGKALNCDNKYNEFIYSIVI